VGIPAALVAALACVPMPTSLGDGTPEIVVAGWHGAYDARTGRYYCSWRVNGGEQRNLAIPAFPKGWLHRPSQGTWYSTKSDLPAIMRGAYRVDPQAVEEMWGTHNNVAGFFHPFPARPVALSPALLAHMAVMRFNPRAVGGPDIPPGSYPAPLLSQPAQMDTGPDNNQLEQLHPGEVPRPLKTALGRD
jgi:hypothetical protein